jgi:hypothetical protein
VIGEDVAGDLGLARGHGAKHRARVLGLLAHRARHGREEPVDAGARGGTGRRPPIEAPFQRLGLALEGRRQDVFLAAKALVQRAQGHTRRRCHVALAHVLEATLLRQGDGDVEDAVLAIAHGRP